MSEKYAEKSSNKKTEQNISVFSSQFEGNMRLCTSQLVVLWQQMLKQACVCHDQLVKGLLATGISSHANFPLALAALLGRKLGDRSVAVDALTELIQESFEADPDIVCAAAADLVAIHERDAACTDLITPFLFFKGYHAVQCYRVAHWLWQQNPSCSHPPRMVATSRLVPAGNASCSNNSAPYRSNIGYILGLPHTSLCG